MDFASARKKGRFLETSIEVFPYKFGHFTRTSVIIMVFENFFDTLGCSGLTNELRGAF